MAESGRGGGVTARLEDRQGERDARDDQRAVADADLLLEAEHAGEHGRVVLAVRGRVARQRYADGEEEERNRQCRDDESPGRAAPEVDPEGDWHQRQERHEVSLLEALGVDRRDPTRLRGERERDEQRERDERLLDTPARGDEPDE